MSMLTLDFCLGSILRIRNTAVISILAVAYTFFRPNLQCTEGPGIMITKRILNHADSRTWYKAFHLLIFYIIFIATIIDSITGDSYM